MKEKCQINNYKRILQTLMFLKKVKSLLKWGQRHKIKIK